MMILAAAFAVLSQPAVAGPAVQTPQRRVLVWPDLTTRDVVVTKLGEVVKYLGPSGRPASVPLSELLAILPADRSGSASGAMFRDDPDPADGGDVGPRSLLMLASGEVIRGEPVWPEAPSESFGWKSDMLGLQAVQLDAVLGWYRPSATGRDAARPAGGGDVIIMANGDMVSGFLETVSRSKIDVEVDGKKRSLEPAVVVSAMLATPPKLGVGPMVFLSDGSTLLTDGLGVGSGSGSTVAATRQGQSLVVSADTVIAYAGRAGSLASLAGLQAGPVTPTGGRDWTPPIEVVDPGAPMGVSDVVFPGPMEAQWVLPGDASRVAATLELDPASRIWGDCVVTVTIIPSKGPAREVVKSRLWEESATASFVAEVAGGSTLRVRVEPGEKGPVQDRVVIRRPLILVGMPPAAKPATPQEQPKPDKPAAAPSSSG